MLLPLLLGFLWLGATGALALTATTITLGSSVNPSRVSQNTTLTATMTPAAATGTVTFKDGSTTLGTGSLSGGVATLVKNFTTTGTHNLTAVYGGNSTYAASTSVVKVQTVNAKAATATVLVSSPNPSIVGKDIGLTATVTPSTASGTVTFKDGATSLGSATLSGGIAKRTTILFTTGAHTLTAEYAGDTANAASASAAVAHTVNAKPVTTTALSSAANPSFVGQSVQLIATVAPYDPSVMLIFVDGDRELGTAFINGGEARTTVVFNAAGTYRLAAVYPGDAVNAASTSAVVTQTVNPQQNTATVLTSSINPSAAGQSTVLTAKVTPATATGSVSFLDGSTVLATANVSDGTASFTAVLPQRGVRSLTARYSGAAGFVASTSAAVSQTVNVAPTTVVLTSSANPAALGQYVTLTATMTPATASGTVYFKDGEGGLGGSSISNGIATLTTPFLEMGAHSLTAAYAGNDSYTASTSVVVTETIGAAVTSTALSADAAAVKVGESVTLTATVMPAPASGTVTFMNGTSTLGTAALSAGVATLATSFPAVGAFSLSAAYPGDATHQPSASAPMSLAVSTGTQTVTTLNLTASENPVASGGVLTLRANVSGAAPTGSISFRDGAVTLATVALNEGQPQAVAAQVLAGNGVHSLSATYSGDAGNLPATSNVVDVLVYGANGATPGAMTWLYGYDAEGNLTTATDPNGHGIEYGYDSLSRQRSIRQPAPAADAARPLIQVDYDGRDAVSRVLDPRNLPTTYATDGLGNTRAIQSPDAGAISATYDEAGNPKTRTDARGKTHTYSHDALNRLTRIEYPSGVPTVYEYDGGPGGAPNAAGRRTKVTDESGSTRYTYDALGRVTTKTQVVNSAAGSRSFAMTTIWGDSGASTGRAISVTYPSGLRVDFSHDAAGRPSAITATRGNSASVLLSGVAYNALHALAGWTWGDGTPYRRGFDGFARLSSYPLGNPAGSGAAMGVTRTLGYDDAGRLIGYSHSGGQAALDQIHSYDGLDRLAGTTGSAANYGYKYDATGNRTVRRIGATDYLVTVEAASNRLASVQEPNGSGTATRPYSYDAAGNLTGDGVNTFVYSDRGRMSSAITPNGTVSYLVNGLEQRVSKTGPTVPTGAAYFVFDEQGHLIGEYGATGAPAYEVIYLGDTPVGVVTASGIGYVYADHIDTPRVIARSSDHAIVWRWNQAEAFGATPPNEDPNGFGVFTFNLRFPGQVYDREPGLFYNGYRDYRPSGGRYDQYDPIGIVGGINQPYTYVGGNPLSYTDSSGLLVDEGGIYLVPAAAAAVTWPAWAVPAGVAVVGVGLYQAITPERCEYDDDKCRKILGEIYRYLQTVNGRIDDMLVDKFDLFNFAYDREIPALAGKGTWVGHYKQADGWQRGLRNLIREALKYRCKVPPEAWAAAYRKIPMRPM